jgi:hypothetical protein
VARARDGSRAAAAQSMARNGGGQSARPRSGCCRREQMWLDLGVGDEGADLALLDVEDGMPGRRG